MKTFLRFYIKLYYVFFVWYLFSDNQGHLLGPSDQELLQLLDQCDLSSSRCATPLRYNSDSSLAHFKNNFSRFQHPSSSSLATSNEPKNFSRNELESSYQSNLSTYAHVTVQSNNTEFNELLNSLPSSARSSQREQRPPRKTSQSANK